jgi:anti-sigma regulatory factor (Ser/Thr protein kinase)
MKRHTSVTADAAQLSTLTRFLQEFWSAADLPPAETVSFELALEEIFMNVVMHGSPAGPTLCVDVFLTLCDDSLTLMIEDDGPSFDPLSLAAPDVTASLEERRIGGLGVYLVRQMMDAVCYQRLGARNQLSMTKRVREPTL